MAFLPGLSDLDPTNPGGRVGGYFRGGGSTGGNPTGGPAGDMTVTPYTGIEGDGDDIFWTDSGSGTPQDYRPDRINPLTGEAEGNPTDSDLLNTIINTFGVTKDVAIDIMDTVKGSGSEGGGSTGNDLFNLQRPYLERSFQEAEGLYDQNINLNPDFSRPTELGLNAQAQRALTGSSLVGDAKDRLGQTIGGDFNPANQFIAGNLNNRNPALDYLSSTADGNFLNSNPYIDNVFDRAASRVSKQFRDAVTPGVNAAFGSAGRFGSPAHQQTFVDKATNFGDRLNDLATNIFSGNHQQERDRQLQSQNQIGNFYDQGIGRNYQGAGLLSNNINQEFDRSLRGVGMAPTLANNDYFDISQLKDAGGAYDDLNQRRAREPYDRLNYFSNTINGANNTQMPEEEKNEGSLMDSVMTGLTTWGLTGNPWAGAGAGAAAEIKRRS